VRVFTLRPSYEVSSLLAFAAADDGLPLSSNDTTVPPFLVEGVCGPDEA
jgi:hypothetical protein